MRSVGRLLPRRTVAVRGPGMGIRRLEGIRVLGAFTAVLLISELLSALTTAISGAMLDAVLIPAALAQFTRAEAAPYRRLLPVLALVALIRTLSIAAVVPRLPQIWWYALVGIPLLLGAILTIRLIVFRLRERRVPRLSGASCGGVRAPRHAGRPGSRPAVR